MCVGYVGWAEVNFDWNNTERYKIVFFVCLNTFRLKDTMKKHVWTKRVVELWIDYTKHRKNHHHGFITHFVQHNNSWISEFTIFLITFVSIIACYYIILKWQEKPRLACWLSQYAQWENTDFKFISLGLYLPFRPNSGRLKWQCDKSVVFLSKNQHCINDPCIKITKSVWSGVNSTRGVISWNWKTNRKAT